MRPPAASMRLIGWQDSRSVAFFYSDGGIGLFVWTSLLPGLEHVQPKKAHVSLICDYRRTPQLQPMRRNIHNHPWQSSPPVHGLVSRAMPLTRCRVGFRRANSTTCRPSNRHNSTAVLKTVPQIMSSTCNDQGPVFYSSEVRQIIVA